MDIGEILRKFLGISLQVRPKNSYYTTGQVCRKLVQNVYCIYGGQLTIVLNSLDMFGRNSKVMTALRKHHSDFLNHHNH